MANKLKLECKYIAVCANCDKPLEDGETICSVCKPEAKDKPSWIEELRDLYLTTSPDEEGLCTESISFNWATFKVDPHEEKIEFYLATKESVEDFIRSLLEQKEREVLERVEKKIPWKFTPMELSDKKKGWNECVDVTRQALEQIRKENGK